MSYNSNKIIGEGSQWHSRTTDSMYSPIVCEENNSNSQCGQFVRTSSNEMSYGFYSEEDNTFYVCESEEEFREFQALLKLK
jgi:hypothetical protein